MYIMSVLVSLYAAILFFILVPGILLRLPANGSKYLVAGVHALVFAVIFHFTHKIVWRFGARMEGMTDKKVKKSEGMKAKKSEEAEDDE